jgi:hypothetical protein
MPYDSVFTQIEERALREGRPMQELFDLSIKHHKDAQLWYGGSRPEVKQFAAEKLLWEDMGCKSITGS